MERVNLLPEEARLNAVERVLLVVDKSFPRILAGTVGSIVGIGLVLWLGQGLSLLGAGKQVKSLKQEIQLLQVETQNREGFHKQLDQVEQELRRQKGLIDQKLAYLSAAKNRPKIWAAVLQDLRRNIPSGVWLSNLETGPGGSLKIAGGALDENLVTQFMSSLKASPRFSDVGFTFTEKDAIGRTSVVRFEIVCRVG